jgi:predicted ATPase
LEFSEDAHGFVILSEWLSKAANGRVRQKSGGYFDRDGGKVVTTESRKRSQEDQSPIKAHESVLSRWKNPFDPTPISQFGRELERVRIFTEFRTTGANTELRMGITTSARKDFLDDGGANLALVLLDMDFQDLHHRIKTYLKRFCDRFEDVRVRLNGSIAETHLKEAGLLESIPGLRMSDGTLKFLCLLVVLLNPDPPPLVCIEEPELGLHPDALQIVADLLIEASERTQLIVTTHSDALIDALSSRPESVLVCERGLDNGTQLKRLDKKQLSVWLKRYSLGELWRKGEIGGNPN